MAVIASVPLPTRVTVPVLGEVIVKPFPISNASLLLSAAPPIVNVPDTMWLAPALTEILVPSIVRLTKVRAVVAIVAPLPEKIHVLPASAVKVPAFTMAVPVVVDS